MLDIRPQSGPQEQFLATAADIAIYGGAAGGGKSFALLLEPLRHKDNPRFGGAVFRRTSPELAGVGSLWEEANGLYRPLGAKMRESPALQVEFPSGALLQFLHLQHANDVYSHQGKQYPYIGFDELTHFEAFQFWYMVSRMRSTSGVRPYMRCTTNPDPDSFVRQLIGWWLDDGGTAIPERSGVLRWFIRDGDDLVWGDSREELMRLCSDGDEPMSLTFIAAKLEDNPALLEKDPGYRARLKSLPEVERLRLLGGNWDVRHDGGRYVQADMYAKRWTALPPLNIYMASDFAVREKPAAGAGSKRDPDHTEHGVFGVSPDDELFVVDWWSGQTKSDTWIETLIDMWAKWKPQCWFGEDGVIRRAVEPWLTKRMMERRVYANMEWLSTMAGDDGGAASKQGFADRSKRAKAIKGRSFQAMSAAKRIVFPVDTHASWVPRIVGQCVGFPVGKDDAFDVMANMCRAINESHPAILPPGIKPKKDPWADERPANDWKTA